MTGKQYRALAAQHATLERLYLRLAARQELHDSVKDYGVRVQELAEEVVELTREIRELERDMQPPAPVPAPGRP